MVETADEAMRVGHLLSAADDLAAAGRHREAVAMLARQAPRDALDVHLRTRELRHAGAGPAGSSERCRDVAAIPRRAEPSEPGLPDVHRDELTADVLAAALQHRGGVVVRGWLDPDLAGELARLAGKAIEVAGRALAEGGDPVAPWYVPFEPDPSCGFGTIDRSFARWLESLLTVESPTVLARVIDALAGAGTGELLEAYLGEWPVISAKKSTLRLAHGLVPALWHQEGAFLGADIKTVNTWIALTHCGVDAPGLDVVVHGFDHIVETGSRGARFDWAVGDDVVGELALPVVRPVLAPGDALFFDQFTLHRTGLDPTMPEVRLAIESWFFAPSTCPSAQVPLLF